MVKGVVRCRRLFTDTYIHTIAEAGTAVARCCCHNYKMLTTVWC